MEKIIINSDVEVGRLDNYLIDVLNLSRNKIQKLIKTGGIKVNGEITKSSYNLKENDSITIYEIEEESDELIAEALNLKIVYEDEDVIVIDKENGMVVHPGYGNNKGTVLNGLLHHTNNLSSVNELRPGIVHRIDAYTTGLMMVAKNNVSHVELANQLSDKTVVRKYYALVWGVINNDTGTIDAPIGRDTKDRKKYTVTATNSKEALTHFRVIKRFKEVTLLEVELVTGRTHQIRVHLQYIGHPIVNDPVYGKSKLIDETGQCLHAKQLSFVHPSSKEKINIVSELPLEFINIMNNFE